MDMAKHPGVFLRPTHPKLRHCEALRARHVERCSTREAAERFGYNHSYFRNLCADFLANPRSSFFLPEPETAEATEPTRSRRAERDRRILELRDQRRLSVGDIADARRLRLEPRRFRTDYGGLFLFLPLLERIGLDRLAGVRAMPGSEMIPAGCTSSASGSSRCAGAGPGCCAGWRSGRPMTGPGSACRMSAAIAGRPAFSTTGSGSGAARASCARSPSPISDATGRPC